MGNEDNDWRAPIRAAKAFILVIVGAATIGLLWVLYEVLGNR